MKSIRQTHKRRSIRLPEYDYSQPGAYFVTLVAHHRQPLFGEIRHGEMVPNTFGEQVALAWQRIPAAFAHCELDEWVVMPDHFHAILWIVDKPRKGEVAGNDDSLEVIVTAPATSPLPPPSGTVPGTLGAILQGFKSITTRRINALCKTPGKPVWQRNYFERVIRNETELDRARAYIRRNPLQWQIDNTAQDDWWDQAG